MAKDHISYSKQDDFYAGTNKPSSIKRLSTSPLDYSQLFLSLEDAQKYAMGNELDPDERDLFDSSYGGQIIGVKVGVTGPTGSEVGIYDGYIIQGDGTLKKLGSDGGEIECLTPAEVDEIFDETP